MDQKEKKATTRVEEEEEGGGGDSDDEDDDGTMVDARDYLGGGGGEGTPKEEEEEPAEHVLELPEKQQQLLLSEDDSAGAGGDRETVSLLVPGSEASGRMVRGAAQAEPLMSEKWLLEQALDAMQHLVRTSTRQLEQVIVSHKCRVPPVVSASSASSLQGREREVRSVAETEGTGYHVAWLQKQQKELEDRIGEERRQLEHQRTVIERFLHPPGSARPVLVALAKISQIALVDCPTVYDRYQTEYRRLVQAGFEAFCARLDGLMGEQTILLGRSCDGLRRGVEEVEARLAENSIHRQIDASHRDLCGRIVQVLRRAGVTAPEPPTMERDTLGIAYLAACRSLLLGSRPTHLRGSPEGSSEQRQMLRELREEVEWLVGEPDSPEKVAQLRRLRRLAEQAQLPDRLTQQRQQLHARAGQQELDAVAELQGKILGDSSLVQDYEALLRHHRLNRRVLSEGLTDAYQQAHSKLEELASRGEEQLVYRLQMLEKQTWKSLNELLQRLDHYSQMLTNALYLEPVRVGPLDREIRSFQSLANSIIQHSADLATLTHHTKNRALSASMMLLA